MIAILAAGISSRFGGDKLLAPCAGRPLGQWALDAALATGEQVVWIGSQPSMAIAEGRCPVLASPCSAQGIGASIAIAANHACQTGASRLMILLADMPLVDPELLSELLSAEPPAASLHAGDNPGVPAVFGPVDYPDLCALDEDTGAARLLRGRNDLHLIPVAEAKLLDVDTPAELMRAELALRNRTV